MPRVGRLFKKLGNVGEKLGCPGKYGKDIFGEGLAKFGNFTITAKRKCAERGKDREAK